MCEFDFLLLFFLLSKTSPRHYQKQTIHINGVARFLVLRVSRMAQEWPKSGLNRGGVPFLICYPVFFFGWFSQGSRQSPLLAKMGGDLGSPSFPPVKAVARALRARDSLPVQGGEALSPLVWGQLVFMPKNFFSTADQGHWEHRELYVCTLFLRSKKK